MEQGSDVWYSQRIGRLTASKFPDLMKNGRSKKTMGETAKTYIKQVAVEAITGIHEEIYSYHLQWGQDHEEAAFEAVKRAGHYFKQAIFCPYKGELKELVNYVGGSPDGINETHVLEIKCPSNSNKHFERILNPQKLVDEYLYQILGEMLVTGRSNAIAASYDPRFPIESQLVIKEVDLSDYTEQMNDLQSRLIEGVNELKQTFKQYKDAISR